MLPIRQIINALPILRRTEKVVLIEVCQLAENSELAGWCTAKNDYLVQALGGTERTMSRTLTSLESRGLLLSKGQGKARKLAPTSKLRACYAGADEATRCAAVTTLNLDKTGHQPRQNEIGDLDKNGPEPSQNGDVEADQPRQNGSTNLDKTGHEPRQNGSRVIGDQHYQQVTSTLSPDEREGFQKKIGDLQAEVAHLKAQLARVKAPPVADTPPRIGYRNFDSAWPEQLHPPFASEAFRQAWAKWATHRYEIGKPFQGNTGESADLENITRLANGEEGLALKAISDSISGGWRNLSINDKQPAHASSSNQHRPAAGGRYTQTSRSGSAKQPLAEGIQIGEPLTGSLDDL